MGEIKRSSAAFSASAVQQLSSSLRPLTSDLSIGSADAFIAGALGHFLPDSELGAIVQAMTSLVTAAKLSVGLTNARITVLAHGHADGISLSVARAKAALVLALYSTRVFADACVAIFCMFLLWNRRRRRKVSVWLG